MPELPLHLQRLHRHAERARAALQAMPASERGAPLAHFPQRSSAEAVLLLGAYLADQGWVDFECVRGERGSRQDDNWQSHAWLRRGSLAGPGGRCFPGCAEAADRGGAVAMA
ncbi:MAG TPA: hypothetical protein VHL79_00325 [Ramlibacter sp.]|jgi:hypothetical protein|nr:hypothetical protein [Ramlibacter sp.]